LRKLAAAGHEVIAAEVSAVDGEATRTRQRDALTRAADLVDVEALLHDAARLELLYSERSKRDYERLEQDLAEFRELRMDSETFAIASGAQRELAALGRHRLPIRDVLIAACAQQHGADVAHVDRDFDVLHRVLAFTPVDVRAV
jgi:predicted nucleic acid-binding protein